ncbi:MAG: S41 family peptidase [Verrucomicrobiales bacterium]|nr:S41 family peptidase [Verrucomicrobiales bacterium]
MRPFRITLGFLIFGIGTAAIMAQTPDPKTAPPPSPVEKKPAQPVTPEESVRAEIEAAVNQAGDDPYQQMQLLTLAMEIIRQNYVNADQVSYADLVEGALEGMLRRLDPHCEYMGRTVFEDMQREQSDTSEGIGVTVALREGVLTIVTVREDGPAARAGVMAGDQIVRIDEVLTEAVGVVEGLQLLRGKAGEPVRLTVRRPGTQQFLEFEMVRETLTETSVHDAMLLHPRLAGDHAIGYVRISQFTQATARDLERSIKDLVSQGMEALVLDLRNNPGGLLDSAVAVCGEFLPQDTLVVTTEGRVAADNPPPYRTPQRATPPITLPLAVLINHGSASAAEITAGALQDLHRAIVVGTTSFGKGSVQTILPMSTGAAMRLTTAKYYTPSHRTIHEHGVEPNIISTLTPDEEARVAKWRSTHGTGEAAALELATLGDHQLERAADALKGILIYSAFNQPTPSAEPAAAPPPAAPPLKLDALLGPSNIEVPEKP